VTLAAGAKLGPYEILAPIGAGGMGEVYRAKDTKLGRDVAIKVLPEEFFEEEERRLRFEREARTLASLNHPGIAAIHSFEEIPGSVSSSSRHLLVMELVEGEDLGQRLVSGPIPLDESLAYAKQIAEALEAAHEKGIVHRDLKPANVKVTPDGRVKLLDFGLAKIFEGDPTNDRGGSGGAVTKSPTLTARATAAGVILGTAAYMSPEQARGKAVDKRTDVWAFGCVLYEMLTGKRAFEGETISDTLVSVLSKEPDWAALPEQTPVGVKRTLRKCLQRDARLRLRDIGDARLDLEEIAGTASSGSSSFEEEQAAPGSTLGRDASASRTRGSRKSLYLSWAVAAALAVVTGTLAVRTRAPHAAAPAAVQRFMLSRLSLSVDPAQSLAFSPDGTKLVYRGRGEDGYYRLYLRAFDSFEEKPIAGTEEGGQPFFSPDSAWIAFFAAHNLKKVSLSGGSPQLICPAKGFTGGGTWLPDDTIVFAGDALTGLDRVSSRGGRPERLLTLDQKQFQLIVSPWALPGGKAVLATVRMGEEFATAVVSLTDRIVRTIEKDAYAPIYIPTGHIVYHQGNSLLALPFDAERLTVTGSAFPVLTEIRTRIASQVRGFGVSNGGSLVYIPLLAGREERSTLAWVDRRGAVTPIAEIPMSLDIPRVSPDDTRIAFRRPAANCDVWIHDIARGTTTRLTLEGDNHGVVWNPDGRRVTFGRVATAAGGKTGILSAPADGSGPPELLASVERGNWFPTSWSPDGRRLLVNWPGHETGADIGLLSLDGERKLTPLLRTPFDETNAVFSRDGRLVAYTSNESGRAEVYAQPYPAMDARVQISTDGGSEPVWSRSGRELFFRQGKKMMAAGVTAAPRLSIGRPVVLFEGDFARGPGLPGYDVSIDDQRFLVVRGPGSSGANELAVVLDWFEEVRHKAAAGGKKP